MFKLELNNSKLTKQQQNAFDSIINHIEKKSSAMFFSHKNYTEYMISLTGAAGTGKTYLTTQIIKYLNSNDYDFIITAPTHKAASVLSSYLKKENLAINTKTIHSFLGIKPFRDYTTGEEKFKLDKSKKDFDTTSILIVDESSMISSNLFDIILEAMEKKRVKFVFFIGDPYQLPPINENKSIVSTLKYQVELKDIVRQQKDNDIIMLANTLRKAIESKNFIPLEEQFRSYMQNSKNIEFFYTKEEFLQDFYKPKNWYNQDRIVASYTNNNVNKFNKTIRSQYWQERGKNSMPDLHSGDKLRFNQAYSYNNVTIYNNNSIVELEIAELKYNKQLEIEFWECKEINATSEQIFRVVDTNSKSIFNNKLKQISNMARKEYNKTKRKQLWKLYFDIKDMFADVKYIYAMTFHKLQGSTYKDIYIDMFSLLNNSMSIEEKYRYAYVAITRASNKAKIYINSNNKNSSSINTKTQFKKVDSLLEEIFG